MRRRARLPACLLALLAGAAAGAEDLPRIDWGAAFIFDYEYRSTDYEYESGAGSHNGIDAARGFLDRPPLARLDLDYGAEYGLAVGTSAEVRRQWDGDPTVASNWIPIGEEGNPFKSENGIITRGVLSWRAPGLELVFGRDEVDYSNGLAGSLLPSPRLPYFDAFRLHGEIGRLGIDWMLASIRARQAAHGSDIDPNQGILTGETPYDFENATEGDPTSILEALHRFTWDFGPFSLGGTAHVLYSRRNNRFELVDLFPVISWHQAQLMQINMSMLLDARWDIAAGLWLAGQYGFDDINAGVAGFRDTGASTIDAWVIGGGWKGAVFGRPLTARAETGRTHVLWGNYDGSQNYPGRDTGEVNPFLRAIYRYPVDGGAILLPLTSPYGPGALWGSASLSWGDSAEGLRLGAESSFLVKNSLANLVDTPYYSDAERVLGAHRAITGRLGLSLGYTWRGLGLELRPALLWLDGDWGYEAGVTGILRAEDGRLHRSSDRSPRKGIV